MRILALDIGDKRIGLAISDTMGILAQPLKTIKWTNIEKLISDLIPIIQEKNIIELVIGMPYNMKGSYSKKTDEVQKIKKSLSEGLSIPVEEEDERLTTKMAERTLHELGKKPSRNRDKIDQMAAMNILQSYLDRKK